MISPVTVNVTESIVLDERVYEQVASHLIFGLELFVKVLKFKDAILSHLN